LVTTLCHNEERFSVTIDRHGEEYVLVSRSCHAENILY